MFAPRELTPGEEIEIEVQAGEEEDDLALLEEELENND